MNSLLISYMLLSSITWFSPDKGKSFKTIIRTENPIQVSYSCTVIVYDEDKERYRTKRKDCKIRKDYISSDRRL